MESKTNGLCQVCVKRFMWIVNKVFVIYLSVMSEN